MNRSTQKELTAIYRKFGKYYGDRCVIRDGINRLSRAMEFYSIRGFTLTPYINGDLNLTWTTGKGKTAQWHRLLTSVEEIADTPSNVILRAKQITMEIGQC